MNTFIKQLTIVSFAAAFAGPALASEDGAVPAEIAAQITALLSAQGFAVEEVEMEDDGYEAEGTKGGEEYEIALDLDLNILSTELDD